MLVCKHSYKNNTANKLKSRAIIKKKKPKKNNSWQNLRETRETKVYYFTKRL